MNMKNNKKCMTTLTMIMIGFALASMSYFFMTVFLFEGGSQYLINPMADIGVNIIGDNTVSSVNASVSTAINQMRTDYDGFSFPYDLFFFLSLISTFSATVWLAFKSNKEGIFSFFGNLFVGSMLMLLITAYVSDFVTWFLSEIFNKVFSDTVVSMPFFLYYLTNLGLFHFIWWIILLIINIIDRTFISKTGEVEE